MKGIILAGGHGTRLYPLTASISKHLLPIYNKPMIYYSLSVLMLAGIRDILIISTNEDLESYKKLLGNGERLGMNFSYKAQDRPRGIAEAFILGENFIAEDDVALILGDNIFFGHNFSDLLINAKNTNNGATIFSYNVGDPERFGIVELDGSGKPISIEEKPSNPKSSLAVTGLYFYNNEVVEIAKKIKPSDRNELEISSINSIYLESKNLNCVELGRGFAWLDAGTQSSLLKASLLVETLESRQGYKIACVEEIAYNNGWINFTDLKNISTNIPGDYGNYLKNLCNKNE
jgi:glucose-1-phosphate thymidylyltransferase